MLLTSLFTCIIFAEGNGVSNDNDNVDENFFCSVSIAEQTLLCAS